MDTNLDTPLSVHFSYPKREIAYIFKCAKSAKNDFHQCLAVHYHTDDIKASTLGLPAIKPGFLSVFSTWRNNMPLQPLYVLRLSWHINKSLDSSKKGWVYRDL